MSLGDHKRCPACKEWGWFGGSYGTHVCKPTWECRGEWDDDSYWHTIHARDAEEAAEKYADHYDCEGGEYAIVQGRSEYVILVRKPKEADAETDTPFERWAVEGEAVPQYRATLIETPTPKNANPD